MRPGRRPKNHPLERKARRQLQQAPAQQEGEQRPKRRLPKGWS